MAEPRNMLQRHPVMVLFAAVALACSCVFLVRSFGLRHSAQTSPEPAAQPAYHWHHGWQDNRSWTADNSTSAGSFTRDSCHRRRHRRGRRHDWGENQSQFRPATVTSLEGEHLTMQTSDGWAKTVVLNDQTVYRTGFDANAQRSDVLVGSEVLVQDSVVQDGSRVATEVRIVGQSQSPAELQTAPQDASIVSSQPQPPETPATSDNYLTWVGFAGLLAVVTTAERRRRRRRRRED